MNNLKYFSQQNYELKKEIERGVIHIPANRRDLEYDYVGLEAVEQFESQSSEFRGFEIEDMSKELTSVMGSILTPMERHIIEMSFGLLSYEEMSVNEIGTELRFTNTHIGSTKKRAMKKLQNYFTKL
jgi:DNA-directed RNA polymerase sigma subunit (sigma70/sigma32)